MKKIFCLGLLIAINSLAINAQAIEKIAKEDTTPPPAEEALKPNQIPPISLQNKQTVPKPAAPANGQAPNAQQPPAPN